MEFVTGTSGRSYHCIMIKFSNNQQRHLSTQGGRIYTSINSTMLGARDLLLAFSSKA